MTTQKILTRDFVPCFFAQFTFSSIFYTLIPTLPIYLSRLGAKEAEIGVLIGVFSVSSLVCRPIVGKALLKIPERRFMIGGTLFFASSSVAYLFAPPFWPLLAVRVFQGIGLAFFSTASFTLLANITPEANRGQIISYFYECLALTGVINFLYFYFAVKKKPKEITFPAGGRVCPPEAGIVGRA